MFEVQQSKSQAGMIQDLTTLKTEFVADGYHVHLFVAGFNPGPNSTHADFTGAEATFTGYSVKDIGGAGFLFIGPMIDANGNVVLATPAMDWIATDAVTPNMIGGYWVEDTANGIRRYGVFNPAVPMATALAFMEMTIFENILGDSYAQINN